MSLITIGWVLRLADQVKNIRSYGMSVGLIGAALKYVDWHSPIWNRNDIKANVKRQNQISTALPSQSISLVQRLSEDGDLAQ